MGIFSVNKAMISLPLAFLITFNSFIGNYCLPSNSEAETALEVYLYSKFFKLCLHQYALGENNPKAIN